MNEPMYQNDQNQRGELNSMAASDELLEGEILEPGLHYRVREQAKELRLSELLNGPAPVTWALIAVILGVYAWFLVLEKGIQGEFSSAPDYALYLGANWKEVMLAEEQWFRMVTSIFLHASVIHIGFNAYALYILGTALERLVGSARYWLIVLISGLSGGVASLMFTGSPSVGISGSVFGLVGALFIVSRKYREFFPDRFAVSLRRGMLQILGINLVIGFIIPRIDNSAHIGGLIGGALMAFLMASRINETEERHFRARAFALLSLVLAVYFATPVKQEIERCGRSEAALARCYNPYFMEEARARTETLTPEGTPEVGDELPAEELPYRAP